MPKTRFEHNVWVSSWYQFITFSQYKKQLSQASLWASNPCKKIFVTRCHPETDTLFKQDTVNSVLVHNVKVQTNVRKFKKVINIKEVLMVSHFRLLSICGKCSVLVAFTVELVLITRIDFLLLTVNNLHTSGGILTFCTLRQLLQPKCQCWLHITCYPVKGNQKNYPLLACCQLVEYLHLAVL